MKILLATDGSKGSLAAARFLRRLQFPTPLQLTLLTVSQDPQRAGNDAAQPWYPKWVQRQEDYVDGHHADLESMLQPDCESIQRVRRHGHAARVIIDQAKEDGSDLVVMGAQGHAMIDRMILGSVSDSVATHAGCSVLVVRPPRGSEVAEDGFEEAEPGGASKQGQPPDDSPLRKLTIAYDGSKASVEAVNEIAAMKWSEDTEVTLLSVAPIYDFMMGDGLSAVAMESEQAVCDTLKDTVDEVCSRLKSEFPNLAGRVEKGRHVGDTIVDISDTRASELVVVGDAGHGVLHDWILGSTTKYVLRHAGSSVWISRRHRSQ